LQVTLDIGPLAVAPGDETDRICYSYTLGNADTVYVSEVEMTATPGVHHSNWLFVPEEIYAGPDGTWDCGERDFDTAVSALLGGVLFAQSTQATSERQAFGQGVVIAIPPRSRIIGNLHLINPSESPLEVRTTLDIRSIREDEVTLELAPLLIQYLPLEIPPMQRAQFSTACDLDAVHQRELGRPLDVRIHYVLPHYHGLGESLRLEAVGGPRDGEVVFETDALLGEAWGTRLDPPYDLTGATGLRLTCTYDNPTSRTVVWGIGEDEMCVVVGFADSELMFGGGVLETEDSRVIADDGALRDTEGDCTILTARPRG
jgi:hypothetical protein